MVSFPQLDWECLGESTGVYDKQVEWWMLYLEGFHHCGRWYSLPTTGIKYTIKLPSNWRLLCMGYYAYKTMNHIKLEDNMRSKDHCNDKFKGYLLCKAITSHNVSSEAQV